MGFGERASSPDNPESHFQRRWPCGACPLSEAPGAPGGANLALYKGQGGAACQAGANEDDKQCAQRYAEKGFRCHGDVPEVPFTGGIKGSALALNPRRSFRRRLLFTNPVAEVEDVEKFFDEAYECFEHGITPWVRFGMVIGWRNCSDKGNHRCGCHFLIRYCVRSPV